MLQDTLLIAVLLCSMMCLQKVAPVFKRPIKTWRGQQKNTSGYTAKNTIQQLQRARNIDVYVSSLG